MIARVQLALPIAIAACASSAPGRFPLQPPLLADGDTRPVHVACREEDGEQVCHPREYVSSLRWDAADKAIFGPVSEALWIPEPTPEAINVNSLDEVPDSSWFVNRIGARPMTPDEVESGPCDVPPPDPGLPDGSWRIDMGKPNGANPGFRIRVNDRKYMLKLDLASEPERATGATAIAARLYHAAGYHAPCDSVVYFRPELLTLKPGLTYTDNSGKERPFDRAKLEQVLAAGSRRGELVRAVASAWLPGRALGPFRYHDVREDDPNDAIPHEHRRDLRGARLLAAWLGHFDSREQNSMDVWLAEDPERPRSSPGHVRHYVLDLGDCFGSEQDWDALTRRMNFSYYVHFGHVAADFVSLGLVPRPWDGLERRGTFNYFGAEGFVPDEWRGGYPNPAFQNMTELDGAWAARILARFEPAHVEAAVRAGDYTDAGDGAFLVRTLVERQHAILRRYLARHSPIADVRAEGHRVCATDLARRSPAFAGVRFAYRASIDGAALAVETDEHGGLCVGVPPAAAGDVPDDHPDRYRIVRIENGQSAGPLLVHLYDLGPERGLFLAGLERP